MISSISFQQAYINLYQQLRNYLWPFSVLESIVDLEISVYQAFPNVSEIEHHFNRLNCDIRFTADDDENLQAAIDDFKELLGSSDTLYLKLNSVQEVNDYDNN